jgi:TolB-like protein
MAQDLRAALLLVESGDVPQVRAMTRLIVLPFRLLRPDPDFGFLSFSLAEAVASTLSGLESLVVRSSMVASRYGDHAPDLKAIATEADVNVVVTGTLLRAGNKLRVNCQMLQVPEGTILCSTTSQAEQEDIFQLQDDLAHRIVEALSLHLDAGKQDKLRRDTPTSAKAYEFYLRANQLAHESQNLTLARELYLKCLEEDPGFAPAWAQLGRIYRVLSKFSLDAVEQNLSHAQTAFERALEINPDLTIAQNLMAHVEVEQGRAPEAMARLLRRVAEQKNDPELFAALVHACRYCGLLDASLAAYKQARRLDRSIRTSVMHTFWMMGKYEEAYAEGASELLGFLPSISLVAMGREEEALALLRDRERQTPDHRRIAYLGALRALLEGQRAESIRIMNEIIDTGFRDPEGIFYLARQYAFLGEQRRALELLERVVDGGYYCYSTMARDPWLDPLRVEPAFARLLRNCETLYRKALDEFQKCSGDRVLELSVSA